MKFSMTIKTYVKLFLWKEKFFHKPCLSLLKRLYAFMCWLLCSLFVWSLDSFYPLTSNQARKLEAQLDEQMHLYRKLVSTKVDNSNDNDVESGIDLLLKQLQQVNLQMRAWVSSGGSEIFSHTLTRHQEILQDLTQVNIIWLLVILKYLEFAIFVLCFCPLFPLLVLIW